jgi:hypothetical protein
MQELLLRPTATLSGRPEERDGNNFNAAKTAAKETPIGTYRYFSGFKGLYRVVNRKLLVGAVGIETTNT